MAFEDVREEVKHIVVKISDMQKYLKEADMNELAMLLRKVEDGRRNDGRPINCYLVVNKDEPYYQSLYQVLVMGETRKHQAST